MIPRKRYPPAHVGCGFTAETREPLHTWAHAVGRRCQDTLPRIHSLKRAAVGCGQERRRECRRSAIPHVGAGGRSGAGAIPIGAGGACLQHFPRILGKCQSESVKPTASLV